MSSLIPELVLSCSENQRNRKSQQCFLGEQEVNSMVLTVQALLFSWFLLMLSKISPSVPCFLWTSPIFLTSIVCPRTTAPVYPSFSWLSQLLQHMILPSKNINSLRVNGFVGGKDFGVRALLLQLKDTYVMDPLSFCPTGGLLHRVSLISLCDGQAKHLYCHKAWELRSMILSRKSQWLIFQLSWDFQDIFIFCK